MPGAPIEAYVLLSVFIFLVGAIGLVVRRSPLVVLMCIELMWNAANVLFLAFARQWAADAGHIFAFLVITVAAAEVAIGLAIVVLLFRSREHVDVDEAHILHG